MKTKELPPNFKTWIGLYDYFCERYPEFDNAESIKWQREKELGNKIEIEISVKELRANCFNEINEKRIEIGITHHIQSLLHRHGNEFNNLTDIIDLIYLIAKPENK